MALLLQGSPPIALCPQRADLGEEEEEEGVELRSSHPPESWKSVPCCVGSLLDSQDLAPKM